MSDSPESLDDVFNGVEPVEEPQAPEVEEPESEEAPTVEEESKPDEQEAPTVSETSDDEPWTKAAVLDERRKRQAIEAEREELRAQLEQLKAPKQEPENVPDVFDDQNKYTEHLTSKFSQELSRAKIEMSQEFMRMQDSDYDTKEAEFVEMAKDNQALAQQLMAHPMPARFVVETVNKARELKKLENIDEYKSQLRAEMEAKVREELKAEMEQKQKEGEKVSSIKPSLATARASKDQGQPEKQSLEELFGR